VFAALFFMNELSRRFFIGGLGCFFILPIVLSVLWFTALKETTYTDWFHLAKVYSSTAGCIGFFLIRHLRGKNKITGKEWRLADNKIMLCFPPLILAINIMEAVIRDFEIGTTYTGLEQDLTSDAPALLFSGPWNFMNGIAGILSIIAITGWFGICIRKKTKLDGSRDMLWPDMIWLYIIPYDIWNFTYTYNAIPHHSWYAGFALLFAPTLTYFTLGKGAWLQHRAHTLALWCMFAQTFPLFQDYGPWRVDSTYDPRIYMFFGLLSLGSNAALVAYMIYKVKKTGRNPYKGELYTDHKQYQTTKALSDKADTAKKGKYSGEADPAF
jgi:hypothetical protein